MTLLLPDFQGKICRGTNRWPWAERNSTWTPKRFVSVKTSFLPLTFERVVCNLDVWCLPQGIQFLIENDLLKNTSDNIAQFLYKGEGLNKTAIGDYLGERSAEFFLSSFALSKHLALLLLISLAAHIPVRDESAECREHAIALFPFCQAHTLSFPKHWILVPHFKHCLRTVPLTQQSSMCLWLVYSFIPSDGSRDSEVGNAYVLRI